jgi:hypothetical protein
MQTNARIMSLRNRLGACAALAMVCTMAIHSSSCTTSVGKSDAGSPDARSSSGKDGAAGGHKDGPGAPPDLPPVGNCQAVSNVGCDPGTKCTALEQATGTLALGCSTIGSKGEGDVCTQVMVPVGGAAVQVDDDCGDGLSCFATQTGMPPICHRMCTADGAAACPPSELCSLFAPGLESVAFCRLSVACQPVEQAGCAAKQACYWSLAGPTCASAGSKTLGEPCASANDCLPGTTCLAAPSNQCVAFCSTTGSPGCPAGSTCTAIDKSSAETGVGYCK